MHDVLVVYKQVEMLFDKDGNLLPYDGQFTHTISYDEKPNIQAIGGAKDRAPIQGKGHWQRDSEYTRHGTLTLLAGIDLQNRYSNTSCPREAQQQRSMDIQNERHKDSRL